MAEVLKGTGVRLFLVEEMPEFGSPSLGPHSTPEERADMEAYHRGEVVYVGWGAFADVDDDGRRYEFVPRYGAERPVHLDRDPTSELVQIALHAREDQFGNVLGDLRIDEMDVTRWEFHAAPFRIALSPKLRERLAASWRGRQPREFGQTP